MVVWTRINVTALESSNDGALIELACKLASLRAAAISGAVIFMLLARLSRDRTAALSLQEL